MASWKYFVVRKPYGMSPAAKCSLPENRNQASYVKITLQYLSRKTVSEDIPGRKTAIRSGQQSREFSCSAIDESSKRREKSLPGSQYRTRARMLSIFSSVGNGLQDINFNLYLHDPDLLQRQPAKPKPASISSSVQAFRDLGLGAVCVLSCSLFLVMCRARFEPGCPQRRAGLDTWGCCD